jgi:inner membrane transporter RhtA
MQNAPRRSIPPVPAVICATFSFTSGAAIAKGLFPTLGAVGTAGIRIGLSALMLLAIFRPRLRALSAEQWRAAIPYGISLAAMNVIFYLAIDKVPLGLAVALEFLGPLGVAIVGSRRALDLVWVALAAAGLALIAPWSGKGISVAGVLLSLTAGAFWAAYIVLGARLSRLIAGGAAVATGMLVAAAIAVPVALAAGGLFHLTPITFAAGAGVALFSSAVPFPLEMIALRALPSRTFGILMSLEPAVASLCGWVFLHERLSLTQSFAVGLVIAASAGATLTSRDSPPPVEV